jgi:hypothetical protein
MRRILIGPLTTAVAVAGIVIGSATVAGATHTVEVGDRATTVAKGAAVIVPVEVTCSVAPPPPPFPFPIPPPPPPFPGSSVGVSVTQRSGNRIASGFGSANVVCDGTPQTVDVLVTASGAPFKNGSAVVTANMFQCDITGCHTATDTEEISVRK